jgi:hypothetical protein
MSTTPRFFRSASTASQSFADPPTGPGPDPEDVAMPSSLEEELSEHLGYGQVCLVATDPGGLDPSHPAPRSHRRAAHPLKWEEPGIVCPSGAGLAICDIFHITTRAVKVLPTSPGGG